MSERRKDQTGPSDEAVGRLLRKFSEEGFEAFRTEWEKLGLDVPGENERALT
jgi:hypothetical protein